MSYGIINQCFGVDLRPDGSHSSVERSLVAMLKDLARLDLGSEVDEWNDSCTLEWAEEIDEYSYGWSAYSGSGEGPLAIGFEIISWPYWDLNGPNGIIATAKKPLTEEAKKNLMERWNSKVPQCVQDVLQKYNITPEIFWTTSTS